MVHKVSELLIRLCDGPQAVSVRHYEDSSEFTIALQEGLLLLTCKQLSGVVELALQLNDETVAQYAQHVLPNNNGELTLEGTLTLDFKPLHCRMRLDAQTRLGEAIFSPQQI